MGDVDYMQTEAYKAKNRANAKRQRERALAASRVAWATSHPGRLHPADRKTATIEERFRDKFTVADSGCWEWIRGSSDVGYTYPSFWFAGKYGKAHRAAYTIFVGEIPDGSCVLHRCDNRICVNPEHLFLGSKADNTQDMLAKKRGGHTKNPPRGQRNASAKISEQDVLRIRELCASGGSQAGVARMFGIGQPAVFKIVHRHRWGHI